MDINEAIARIAALEAENAALRGGAERQRVRDELLAWVAEHTESNFDGPEDIVSSELLEALDRICPSEHDQRLLGHDAERAQRDRPGIGGDDAVERAAGEQDGAEKGEEG